MNALSGNCTFSSFGENANLWFAPAIFSPFHYGIWHDFIPCFGTQGRIRTHEPFGAVLETVAFDHSATCVYYNSKSFAKCMFLFFIFGSETCNVIADFPVNPIGMRYDLLFS